MNSWKVVITDYEFSSLEIEEDVFDGHNIEFIKAQCKTEDEVIEACKDADAILNQYAPITSNVIASLGKCRVIARYGVGVNTIDLKAASSKGIHVCNVTDYCKDEVSDHALSLMLAAARKISLLNHSVKNLNWDYKQSIPIYRIRGRKLGLVGFGNIPQMLAIKAATLGLAVYAYDPYASKELADHHDVKLVDLDTLCGISDFISIHAPLTNETEGMISTEQFKQMKKDAFVINTARGSIIDEEALIEALDNNRIHGAALDVIEKEPLEVNNPLTGILMSFLPPMSHGIPRNHKPS